MYEQYPTAADAVPLPDFVTMQRIAEALERIAAALERGADIPRH